MARKTPTYRPVSITIWDDVNFLALSDEAKLLFLHFLTSSECPIPGILLAGEGTVSERLNWPTSRVRDRYCEITRNDLDVRWEGRVLWCANAFKHQPVAGPNAMKAMAPWWRNIPLVSFKHDVWLSLRLACKGWSHDFKELFDEPERVAIVAVSPSDQVPLPLCEPLTERGTPTPSPQGVPQGVGYRRGGVQQQHQDQDLDPQVFDRSGPEPSAHGGGDLDRPQVGPSSYSDRSDADALKLYDELKGAGFRFPGKGGDA